MTCVWTVDGHRDPRWDRSGDWFPYLQTHPTGGRRPRDFLQNGWYRRRSQSLLYEKSVSLVSVLTPRPFGLPPTLPACKLAVSNYARWAMKSPLCLLKDQSTAAFEPDAK